MSQPASSSGPRPILDLLRERLEHGVRLRNDPDLTRDRLQTWSSLVRMQLQKIYGEGAAEIQYFSCDGILTGPSGRSATVRTVWIFRPEEQFPRFVTALPR
jgi:hypothetical protein